MKFSSVSEAREFGKGQPLPGLTGKVARVWPQEQKEYNGDPYMKQGIVLKDLVDPSVEITLNLMDHAPYDQSIVGKTLQVIGEGKSQVKSEGEYKGKFYFKAGRGCDVTFEGPSAGQPKSAPAGAQAAASKPAAAPHVSRPSTAPGISWSEYLDAEGAVTSLCIQKALQIANKHNEGVSTLCGVGFEPAQIASIAAGLRISGERAGLSIDSPTGAPKAAPKKAAEPEDPGPSDPDDDFVP